MTDTAFRLRMLRERLGLTQKKAAKRAYCTQQAISAYENGTMPSVAALVALAKAYRTSTDYILGLTDDRRKRP